MPATSFQKCSICNTSFHKHQSDLHTYHILFMFKSQYFMRETLQKIGFSKIFCMKKCINIIYQWTLTNKLCLPLRYVILTTSTQKAFCKWFILLTNLLYEEYLYDQLERMVCIVCRCSIKRYKAHTPWLQSRDRQESYHPLLSTRTRLLCLRTTSDGSIKQQESIPYFTRNLLIYPC